jgi:hypothetical protein
VVPFILPSIDFIITIIVAFLPIVIKNRAPPLRLAEFILLERARARCRVPGLQQTVILSYTTLRVGTLLQLLILVIFPTVSLVIGVINIQSVIIVQLSNVLSGTVIIGLFPFVPKHQLFQRTVLVIIAPVFVNKNLVVLDFCAYGAVQLQAIPDRAIWESCDGRGKHEVNQKHLMSKIEKISFAR